MPNFATSAALVETATKCLATDFSSPPRPASDQSRAVWALVMVSRVVNVFEEMMNSVSAGSRSVNRFGEVGAVDVGNEPERHGSVAVMLQRFVGHHRTEVGAADADVDDVANAFAGVPFPRAAPHAVGEISHLVEHGVDLGHDVLAVHDDGRPSRRAQGHVQDRAIFRDVDFVAAEHGIDARAEPAFLGQAGGAV